MKYIYRSIGDVGLAISTLKKQNTLHIRGEIKK